MSDPAFHYISEHKYVGSLDSAVDKCKKLQYAIETIVEVFLSVVYLEKVRFYILKREGMEISLDVYLSMSDLVLVYDHL